MKDEVKVAKAGDGLKTVWGALSSVRGGILGKWYIDEKVIVSRDGDIEYLYGFHTDPAIIRPVGEKEGRRVGGGRLFRRHPLSGLGLNEVRKIQDTYGPPPWRNNQGQPGRPCVGFETTIILR